MTLTYSDDNLPGNLSLSKVELQNYFKMLRKGIYPKKLKYFACGEYGEKNNRPHYHAIIFGLAQSAKILADSWTVGFIRTGTVTYQSSRYVAGYIQKKITGIHSKDFYGLRIPPFQLQSQGIGLEWANKNKQSLITNLSLTVNGAKTGLPRYYVKKLKNEISEEVSDTKKMLSVVKLERYLEKAGVEEAEVWSYLKSLREKKELELDQRLAEYRPRKF